MKAPRVRKAYDRDRVPTVVVGETMTRSAHKDETDINLILGQFLKTGTQAHLERFQGSYGEAPALTYQECMNAVLEARETFATVPAQIRQRFDNDPGKFLAFVHDEKNLPEMRELGLAKPAPPEPPATPAAAPESAE